MELAAVEEAAEAALLEARKEAAVVEAEDRALEYDESRHWNFDDRLTFKTDYLLLRVQNFIDQQTDIKLSPANDIIPETAVSTMRDLLPL